jgi:hypothetical protein
LDVGYNGIKPEVGFVYNVVNKYFDEYFPAAIETAYTLQELDAPIGFIFTTHPFLVSLYLDCPPGMNLHCPNQQSISAFEQAIKEGIITWHAFPFNSQCELFDRSLFNYSFS